MNPRAQQLLAPPFAAASRLYPGAALCVVLALAGSFLAEHYAAPALMLVLLLGFGFASQDADAQLQAGVAFCSRRILRIGVALLGARIGVEQLLVVGSLPVLIVATCVPLVIGTALLFGRWLGLPWLHSLVAGVAVAICGVSAAIAVAAVIPRVGWRNGVARRDSRRHSAGHPVHAHLSATTRHSGLRRNPKRPAAWCQHP